MRESRLAQGRTQADVAEEAGITQPYYSRVERGHEIGVTLEVLASCAAALDVRLAAFIEALPGASLPRDVEHLRRQALVISLATKGAWAAEPEAAVPGDGLRPRSIDVLLARAARREAAVVEVWDLLTDGGEAIRGLEAKVMATRERLGPGWRVEGLLLLRRTARNRQLVRELAPLIAARYPASSAGWLAALTNPDRPMPDAGGFAWSSVAGRPCDRGAARLTGRRPGRFGAVAVAGSRRRRALAGLRRRRTLAGLRRRRALARVAAPRAAGGHWPGRAVGGPTRR